ncbi:MAG TPA: PEGA domain-containing protein, partial [Candidatus Doudnabacteria bacterium]|nr:PEGA domain-containing protein [Candidatus Doudnabacteria bacterium]
SRYLLIAIFFVIFLVMAPLIVLYITGKNLPFTDNSLRGTGILDVQSVPNGADVFLNGEDIGKTPKTTRFIPQGWHNVEVRAEGFRSWKKDLFIETGQVTYAGRVSDTVLLLPDTEPEQFADEVITAIAYRNQIIYVSDDRTIRVYDLDRKEEVRATPQNVRVTELKASNQNDFFFAKTDANQWTILNSETLSLTNLPDPLASAEQLEFGENNTVFGLTNNQLFISQNSQAPTLLLEGVNGFTYRDNLLYIASGGENAELATYYFRGSELQKQLVLVGEGVPNTNNIGLFLTNQKELFLLSNDSLFRVNQQLELLKNSVLGVELESAKQRLTFFTPTEIFFYNFSSAQTELLSRNTNQISGAVVVPTTGYGFISGNFGSEAIEIDNRGNQNRYELFNGQTVNKLMISVDERRLVFLTDRQLHSIVIRK